MQEDLFSEDPKKSNFQDALNIQRIISAYLRRWTWFILSLLVCLFAAWLYTRYLIPVYKTTSRVLIQDIKQGAGGNSILNDLVSANSSNGGLANEIELMQSTRLTDKIVKNLDLNISYYKQGKVIETEIFGNQLPFYIQADSIALKNLEGSNLKVKYNQGHLDIMVDNNPNIIKTNLNKPVKIKDQVVVFKTDKSLQDLSTDEIRIAINSRLGTSRSLKRLIGVSTVNRGSTILELSIEQPNTHKSAQILNELVSVYNLDAIYDRNLEFRKTAEFIDDRINIINRELSDVESNIEDFKVSNDVAQLSTEISQSISKKTQLESQLLDAETKISLVNMYNNYIQDQDIGEVLPSNIGATAGAGGTVSQYNALVNRRNQLLLSGAKEEHPEVQNLTANLKETKRNIEREVEKHLQVLNKNRGVLAGELSKVSSFKKQAPSLERISRDIDRQQQIKENLYLVLLQKREETAINLAITSPKAKVIDPPYTSGGPIRPIKRNYYLGAVALGILIPFLIIYLKEFLNNKIETKEDIEEFTGNKPVVAEIPRLKLNKEDEIVKGDLSELSEAFRILRTNTDYHLKRITNNSKVILVTSSIKGEGKTFIAMNYAHILSQIKEAKVILVGADIRNPQLHRFDKSNKSRLGLTEYLYGEDTDYKPYVNVSSFDNKTDLLYSGNIPPNPTELLMSNKFDALIEKLKEDYDYVIIDSAPIVLVSDTFHISDQADVTLYVVRSEATPKSVLRMPVDAEQAGKLKKILFVLNDISNTHSGYSYGYKYNYGYGYGYGTGKEKTSIFQKIKASLLP